jgi:glycosyltransferase involved in cell wall biosynthesis
MNKIPQIEDLPKADRHGWPWTEALQLIREAALESHDWPKISIVTPSYNQGQYLEETIRSVLLQGYPNLEYIIIDGGSTDSSVEIIKKYEPWLTYWESKKDAGQSQAINKGFAQSTGEIMAWINSDDFYAPGAFSYVARAFLNQETFWVAGITHKVDSSGNIIAQGKKYEESLENWHVGAPYLQPGIFWRRQLWQKSGQLDESLHYSFDYDLLMRFIQYQPFAYWIDQHIANFRIHSESKSGKDQLKFMPERQNTYKRYPYEGKSLKKKFYIWKMRRERKARIYMELTNDLPMYEILYKILITSPWFFTRTNFLYWIKKKVQG